MEQDRKGAQSLCGSVSFVREPLFTGDYTLKLQLPSPTSSSPAVDRVESFTAALKGAVDVLRGDTAADFKLFDSSRLTRILGSYRECRQILIAVNPAPLWLHSGVLVPLSLPRDHFPLPSDAVEALSSLLRVYGIATEQSDYLPRLLLEAAAGGGTDVLRAVMGKLVVEQEASFAQRASLAYCGVSELPENVLLDLHFRFKLDQEQLQKLAEFNARPQVEYSEGVNFACPAIIAKVDFFQESFQQFF